MASSSSSFHEPSALTNSNADHRPPSSLSSCCGLFSSALSRSSPTRVYQVWPGKNVFFFKGRVICGPDPRGLLLTAVSIVLPEWMFCCYVSNTKHDGLVIMISPSLILTVLVIVTLALASTRDPGIIPRNEGSSNEGSSRARRRRITIDGIEIKIKYCKKCKIFPSPRSCHCTVCDNCVEKFDHHCPWLGQCVGLRNFRYYMMFVFSALGFFIYVLSFSCWRIGKKMSGNKWGVFEAAKNLPETFALALFCSIAIVFLGILSIFHVYLIILNKTTKEYFKQCYLRSPNPYDKGIICNIKDALFTKLPPSNVNFRAVVEEQNNSFKSSQGKNNSVDKL